MKDITARQKSRLSVSLIKGPKKPTSSLCLEFQGRHLKTTPIFDTFWRYAAERQSIEIKRRAGESQPWTTDPVLQTHKFCSVFRVADRGSQFLIREVIEKGSQKHEDIVFRVLLYNIFTRIDTYKLLESRLAPLTAKSYDQERYTEVLQEAMDSGNRIYTGAFQKPAPSLGYRTAFKNHLVLLEVMMGTCLAETLAACEYMADAFNVIYSYPGMGDFMAFQLLIDLSYTPVLNFSENDFVMAGVGAKKGLKKCFQPASSVSGIEEEIIRYMMDTQDEQFARLGLSFTGFGGRLGAPRRMTLVDIEHTLCEVHKYSVIALSSGSSIGHGKRFVPTAVLPSAPHLPRAWAHRDRKLARPKPGKREPVKKQYVVSEVLDRRITDDGIEFLVDWLGYSAAHRTWEPEESLREDAPIAVEEYEAKQASLTRVRAMIAESKRKGVI